MKDTGESRGGRQTAGESASLPAGRRPSESAGKDAGAPGIEWNERELAARNESGGKQSEAEPFGDGRRRVIIEGVSPAVDAGRFPIKRVVGERVEVEADIFTDSHDLIMAVVQYRHDSEAAWSEAPLSAGVNDHWRGSFVVTRPGDCSYRIMAWINHFRSWQRDLEKRHAAGQDLSVEFVVGAQMIRAAAARASGSEQAELKAVAESLGAAASLSAVGEGGRDPGRDAAAPGALPVAEKTHVALSPRLRALMEAHSERPHASISETTFHATVDPVLARFGAWYELFPRSCAAEPGRHGTFNDCAALLPRIAAMGFDVLYLPPIHPIGRSFRKGKNGSLTAGPEDPGSPWAIGGPEGGHKAVLPDLGTLEDFRRLVKQARALNLEVALDIAFQCSPDHPYVKEHPEWFRHRPDGSIQYAENPPKKYQDIYPFDFETADWRALWDEIKSIFEFWIEQGVRVFRVDNPHTKPFRFWEWCLTELKRAHPELIFLSEAFTRPRVMYYLAKLGFTQSYNYFPWRNNKYELTTYLTELTQTGVRDFFRPNLWPNTPDILTQQLQYGGRPAFVSRLILAATLGASYGIYGPPFEFCENKPREPGSEEYLNSEKYEIRHWDFEAPESLGDLMARVNRIRRENPPLQSNGSLRFHPTDNEQLIAYSKHSEDFENIILTVVNLDPHHIQRGWVDVDLESWGLGAQSVYQVHELLTDARFLWTGRRNFVELNPVFVPAHIFRLRRHVRREQDFDYFM